MSKMALAQVRRLPIKRVRYVITNKAVICQRSGFNQYFLAYPKKLGTQAT